MTKIEQHVHPPQMAAERTDGHRVEQETLQKTPMASAKSHSCLRVVQVTAVGITAQSFLIEHFKRLSQAGYQVTLVSSPDEDARKAAATAGIELTPVPMHPRISPLADLVSLWRLRHLFRRMHPTVVHAHMSKAGLLAMLAAWMARAPVRIYHNHGFAFLSARGSKRWLLRSIERITCRLATDVFFVAPSGLQAAVDERVVSRPKGRVIGPGTISGVDLARFDPLAAAARGLILRRDHNIPDSAHIVGFVGRLVPHKGVAMLLSAWRLLPADVRRQAYLCFIGSRDNAEMGTLVDQAVAEPDFHVKYLGFQTDMPAWYATMTVLASPSWHEGWPYNVVEASCSGVPTVGTQASGTVEAVIDRQTGLLTPIEDAPAFAESLSRLLTDDDLRRRMGQAARERMHREFSHERIIGMMVDEYARITNRGIELSPG